MDTGRDLDGSLARETQYHIDCGNRHQLVAPSQSAVAAGPGDAAHARRPIICLYSDYAKLVPAVYRRWVWTRPDGGARRTGSGSSDTDQYYVSRLAKDTRN